MKNHPFLAFLEDKAEKAMFFCIKVWAAILVGMLFRLFFLWLGWL